MSEWNEIRRTFREALISGFNWNSLSLVLRYHCDRRLDRITSQNKGFDANVDDVIDDAVRNGWLEKLAQGALEENERHTGLKDTVPHIVAGVEAKGPAYYQREQQRNDSREPGSSVTTIIQGDVFTIGDISDSEGIAIGRSSSASVEESTPAERSTDEAAGGPEADVQELHRRLVDQFNIEELQDLCFALGIDYEELGGTGKSAKARELVLYMQRRGRLDELSEAIRAKRG
jgi:hypothetical protein